MLARDQNLLLHLILASARNNSSQCRNAEIVTISERDGRQQDRLSGESGEKRLLQMALDTGDDYRIR